MTNSLIDKLERAMTHGQVAKVAASAYIGVTRSTLHSWLARATPIRPRHTEAVIRFIHAVDAAVKTQELGDTRKPVRETLAILRRVG